MTKQATAPTGLTRPLSAAAQKRNPLHLAASSNHFAVAELLVQRGADIDAAACPVCAEPAERAGVIYF